MASVVLGGVGAALVAVVAKISGEASLEVVTAVEDRKGSWAGVVRSGTSKMDSSKSTET